MTQESVTLSDSEESLEICKMTEQGSVHQSELNLIARMKNGISAGLLAFSKNPPKETDFGEAQLQSRKMVFRAVFQELTGSASLG